MEAIDLRKLSQMTSPDRAFLTIYGSAKKKNDELVERLHNRKRLLKKEEDEYLQFTENLKLVEKDLKKNPIKDKSFVIFCCWALDFYERHVLGAEVEDIIRVDSSPYILPIAQLRDEYEDHLVITATNDRTKIFLVSVMKDIQEEEAIHGHIKNHVKVGGWSQQRYERRRDKEFSRYTKEISDTVKEMLRENDLRRIILIGSRETMHEISEAFPREIKDKIIGQKALDLRKGEDVLNREVFDLLWQEERRSETEAWALIRGRLLKGELAVSGIEDVVHSLKEGRVAQVIVDKNIEYQGIRCRDCEELTANEADTCPKCNSVSVFKVDLKNEIVELAELTGAEIEFAEEIEELNAQGGIAALLRY